MTEITAEFICDDILVIAECKVTGQLIPATFEHDKEDERDIDQHGFIFWGGIGCNLSSLTDDCALKIAALKAK